MWQYLRGRTPAPSQAETMLIAAQKKQEEDGIGGNIGLLDPTVKRRVESAIFAGQLQLEDFDAQQLLEVSKCSAEKQEQVLDRFLAMCEPDAETSDANGEKKALFASAVRSVMTPDVVHTESESSEAAEKVTTKNSRAHEANDIEWSTHSEEHSSKSPDDHSQKSRRRLDEKLDTLKRRLDEDSGHAAETVHSQEPDAGSDDDEIIQTDTAWANYSQEDYSWEKEKGDYSSQVTMRVTKSPTGYREVTLDMQNWKLGDEGLRETLTPALQRRLQTKVEEVQPGDRWHYINVDLSGNELGPEGAEILLHFLHSTRKNGGTPCYVRILKLYKNELGDEGMKHVAAMILTQPKPVHEIHLSHNGITAMGAITLVLSLGQIHPQEAYPLYIPPKYERCAPCWCRLERNRVEVPEKVIQALQRSGDIRVLETTRSTKDWGPLRSPKTCSSAEDVPHAILHIFSDQQDTSTAMKVKSKHIDNMIYKANEILFDMLSEDVQNWENRKGHVQKTSDWWKDDDDENSKGHVQKTSDWWKDDDDENQKGRKTSETAFLSKPPVLLKRKDAEEVKQKPGSAVDEESLAFLNSLSSNRQRSAPVTCEELESAQQNASGRVLLESRKANRKHGDSESSVYEEDRRMSPPPPDSIPFGIAGQKLDPKTLFGAASGMPQEQKSRTQSSDWEQKSRTQSADYFRNAAERHSPIPSDDDYDEDSWNRRVAREQAFHMILQWKGRVSPDFFAKCEMQIEQAKSPLEIATRINATAQRLEALGYLTSENEGTEHMLQSASLLYHRWNMKRLLDYYSRNPLTTPTFGFSAPSGVTPPLRLPSLPPGFFVAPQEGGISSSDFGKGKEKGKGKVQEKGKSKVKGGRRGEFHNNDNTQYLLKGQESSNANGKDIFLI